ncbi:MAG: hypothetical protein KDJ16_17470 [Hyphomicrobiales bacterium]|nr:hypothetical protein [Hyphomicrobiales bacterium]
MSAGAIPPRGLMVGTAQSWRHGTYDVYVRDRGQRGFAAEVRYTSHADLKTKTGASISMPISVAREVAAALIKAAEEVEKIGGADAGAN